MATVRTQACAPTCMPFEIPIHPFFLTPALKPHQVYPIQSDKARTHGVHNYGPNLNYCLDFLRDVRHHHHGTTEHHWSTNK